ncbi:MAG TPA: tetratricopeptide repeat protein [Vicinamibacterales bacterium]
MPMLTSSFERNGSLFGARRTAVVLALALTVVVGSHCTGKPAVAPSVPTAPHYADFVFPDVPPAPAVEPLAPDQTSAWQVLQAGDPKGADRAFAAILKRAPSFYPAEAGLGYAALARRDGQAAIGHFDRALAANGQYAPALAGKGDALLSLGRTDAALQAFQAALAANPGLTGLKSRVDVLKFQMMQQEISTARKSADSGDLNGARREYQTAIAASPESAFLYRELAAVEQRAGDPQAALDHAQQAAKLDPTDPRALTLIGEVHEAHGEWTQAADAYAAANALEPGDPLASKVEAMRDKAAMAVMPDGYRDIAAAQTITRAQLAALIGVRLQMLLRLGGTPNPPVITDLHGNWASPWILAVASAGIMDVFPNHTFQPSAVVQRGDLAQSVSRLLTLLGAIKPKLASRWRDAHPAIADVPPSHLSYPAVARAIAAGVMAPLTDGTFQLTRPVSGAEAIDAVSKLEALSAK